jgi:hypothetical protein
VAAALGPLLADGEAREKQMAALAEVRGRLAAAGSPVLRVAEAVLELLDGASAG